MPSRIILTFFLGLIESCRTALITSRPAKSLSLTTYTIWDSSYRRSMLTERTRYPILRTRTLRKNSRSISSLKLLRSPAPMPLISRMCILIGATVLIQPPTRTRTPYLMIRTTMIVMWIIRLPPCPQLHWQRKWQAQFQIVRLPPGRAAPHLAYHTPYHSPHSHPPYQWVVVVP